MAAARLAYAWIPFVDQSPQNYDVWKHNCNNFSNDLATFLVGKGIPEHIVKLPDIVLNSPFGPMLMPMLNQQVTQNRRRGGILGIQDSAPSSSSVKPESPSQLHPHEGRVQSVSSLQQLDAALAATGKSCAVVFFTSQTCPPCKTLYGLYDELAAEVGTKGALLKVDTAQALDVTSKYSVSATPTFITFLHGQQENRWVGAEAGKLRGNVQLLVQMAWPAHPHDKLPLPTFANPAAAPVLATKVPPLAKLLGKLPAADAAGAAVQGVRCFLEARARDGPADGPLPDVGAFAAFVRDAVERLPPEVLFAVVDLFRCALADARFSGAMAEETGHATVAAVLGHVNGLGSQAPYALRLVTLHMACNLFSSPLYPGQVLGSAALRTGLTQLMAGSFLDERHSHVRVAAASLLYNVALAHGGRGREGPADGLPESEQVELAAAVLEAMAEEEESVEALEGMLKGLGWLVYRLPLDGELAELLRTMDARETILAKEKTFPDLKLIHELGRELLGKGLTPGSLGSL